MDEFDVAIVGAGPAGSSAAIAARRRGARVLLMDKAAFPRDKTCGDGIPTHALDMLRDLGVTGIEDGYPPVPSLHLVGPNGASAVRRLAQPDYTIPRTVFDARLVDAAVSAGATLTQHTVRTLEERDNDVVIDGIISAKMVIGADGAYSLVRRTLGQPSNPDGAMAIAIRGYAPAVDPGVQEIITAPAARWPAYAWNFPIGDGRANIGYGEVLRGDPLSRAHLLNQLEELLPHVDTRNATALRAHHLPLSTHRPIPGRGRMLLSGDALSMINPFSGEGIFYAIVSGALAGAAATAGLGAVRQYRDALRRRLGRHLRHSRVTAYLTRRAHVVDATIRAVEKDQRVFDTVAGLGLGDGRLTVRTLISVFRNLR
ncbi:MAG TPA: geranylgeranyl reductase family protein [Micromonosporaceae bacterium]|jgi:geranylgeranyl reductase family protein